jgi:hypothetical protein
MRAAVHFGVFFVSGIKMHKTKKQHEKMAVFWVVRPDDGGSKYL